MALLRTSTIPATRRVGSIALALALSAGALAGCGGRQDVRVPPLAGQELSASAVELANAGLHVRVRRVPNPAALGRVVDQDPAPERSVSSGSAVTLSVSAGPRQGVAPPSNGQASDAALSPQAAVPAVLSLRQVAAQDRLAAAGFSVIVEPREGAPAPGHVIGQTPGPSTRLKAGSPVTIVVAKSVPQVAVPDVSGQTEAHAVKALSGAGLTVQLALSNVSDRAKEGVVLSQRPSGYATVRRGAATTVTVGRYLAPPPPKNKKKSKRRASTTNPPFSKNRPLPESQPGANAAPPN